MLRLLDVTADMDDMALGCYDSWMLRLFDDMALGLYGSWMLRLLDDMAL